MKATQCAVDGCERGEPIRHGMCNMHYLRWAKRGTTDAFPAPSPAERFTQRLMVTGSGCIEWIGARRLTGYGAISVAGKMVPTHRFAWELANGPIPEGMFVCHKCDNPPCCNVDHLFLGTPKENTTDMVNKGRRINHQLRKTHCPQGHEYTDANTYVNPQGWRTCQTCHSASKERLSRRSTPC